MQLVENEDAQERSQREHSEHERPEVRVTRHVEMLAAGDQSHEQRRAHAGLLSVEPLQQMGDGDPRNEHDRELPGAALATTERAR